MEFDMNYAKHLSLLLSVSLMAPALPVQAIHTSILKTESAVETAAVSDGLRIVSSSLELEQNAFLQLQAVNDDDSDITSSCLWESADPSIASVDTSGNVFGWHAGSTEITASSGSLKASVTVTVEKGDLVLPEDSRMLLEGAAVSDNTLPSSDAMWAEVITSYLYESEEGLVRVQYTGSDVLTETFSPEGQLLSTKHIDMALPLFGGFFHGQDKNYLLFGQRNPDDSDDCVVLTLQEYSHDWTLQKSLDIKGENTWYPFHGGSCRFTETDTHLYIYSCHEMYAIDDLHHQANMIFEIDKSSLQITQKYTDIMNIAQAGYVSHSFNQFIRHDGTNLYRVDHGDASPRGIALIKSVLGGDITSVSYTIPYEISGDYSNYTGVSLGGFELSGTSCLIAGNSINQDDYDNSEQRNIFVTITSKDLASTETIWLTNHAENSDIYVSPPYLTKLNESAYLVTWMEDNGSTKKTCAVTMDDQGHITDRYTYSNLLSECEPILLENGLVAWYTSQSDGTYLYCIQPFQLDWEVSAHTHKPLDNVTFTWSDDYASCTASYTCAGCGETVSEPCSITRTDDEDGYATLTATLQTTKGTWSDTVQVHTELLDYGFYFEDVPAVMWYHDVVYEAAVASLMTGYDSSHFAPNDSMTRGMVATVLYRMAGSPEVEGSSGFEDVPDGYFYSDPITWAVQKGIVTGYKGDKEGTFGPNDNITREQMCTMVFRYLDWAGYDTSDRADLSQFKDADKVNDYAKEPVEFCVAKGIISGAENGTMLNPLNNATRAECAKILLYTSRL